ncbi:MAG: hypothetical protein FD130_2590, partial [Halothiobacillaceae bacterium]
MDEVSLSALFIALIVLIIFSAFFSAAEIALMTVDRYRLRHLTKVGHRGAKRAQSLLKRPDRLIGVILLGSNFTNALLSTLTTVTAIRILGEQESTIVVATIVIALVILIFTDLAPKTLAALHPERIAFPSAYVLEPLLKLIYPVVWIVNGMANGVLRTFGVSPQESATRTLSSEEIRMVINEAGAMIPRSHQQMLLNIMDLEKGEDIMTPRNEIIGIDLEDDWNNILDLLTTSQHTRLPLYRGDINNVMGILHVRNILHKLTDAAFNHEDLIALAHEPYYIPEGTSLNGQLLNFQRQKRRIGLVVDEYGDINGLVTLEDILEEIVGEFTTDISAASPDVYAQKDNSFLVSGSANIRDLNRAMHWHLPVDGPRTINGLVLEYLESIPSPGTSLLIANYPIEIVQTAENSVKMVRILPRL